jgi:hypothetical protein
MAFGRSPGRHYHPTLSVVGIGSHSLGIYAVTLLSLLSFSAKMTVSSRDYFGGAPLGAAEFHLTEPALQHCARWARRLASGVRQQRAQRRAALDLRP